MSKKLTEADASPKQLAWLKMKALAKKDGRKISDYIDTHPEEVKLSREYMAEYMRDWRKNRRVKRETFSFQESMPWYEITSMTGRYQAELGKGVRFEDIPDNLFKRETASYYSRIMKLNRAKAALHPNINPLSLGPDPRKRNWPSGKIEYSLSYIPKPMKKRSHHAKKVQPTAAS